MSAPGVSCKTDEDLFQKQSLEEFVVDNDDLARLESLLQKFNLFDALNLVKQETKHSDFLAYLLDPLQNHGLRDSFLTKLLQSALKGQVNSDITPIDIDSWNLHQAEVQREWHNIDIFIRDQRNRLAVLIENKVQSGEHSNQLARYYDDVLHECPGWSVVAIYLTVDGDEPSHESFIAVTYGQICEIVERLVGINDRALDADVRTIIRHYTEMLRRHLVAESDISEMCRRIYTKHKPALDLIFEHKPDRQKMVQELLQSWIKQDPHLELDDCTKSYIRFIPKQIDTALLKQGLGWTHSGRILLFEAHNAVDHVTMRLIIGPGPEKTRGKLLEIAQTKRPPFKPGKDLHDQWNRIFTRRLFETKFYELPDEQFKREAESRWKQFIEADFARLVEAIAAAPWIHGSAIPE